MSLLKSVLLLGVFLYLNSCSTVSCPSELFLLNGRRPQVMEGAEECVLDYGGALDEFDEEDEEDEEACEERVPITADLLDPYAPPTEEFYFSVGDVLAISVFGELESPVDHAIIAPDGYLYYAFLDGIPAAGSTHEILTKRLEKALNKYFKYPKVVLNLQSSPSLNWKIFGQVQKPGVYLLIGPISLRQAIGAAGGLATESYEFKTPNTDLDSLANLKESFLIRNNRKLDIDFSALVHKADKTQDIYLKPGDYIYIANFEYREVYVLGNVRVATRLEYLEDMTLMQALALAGGWPIGGAYAADISNCLVIRGNLDNPRLVKCNLNRILEGEAKDFYLVPGDIVYVHNKSFRFAREMVRLAVDTFIESFGTVAGSYYSEVDWFHINTSTSTAD
jgi:polysaccharide biosynthesis/export protein